MFEYDKDRLFREGALAISRGVRVVLLHGLTPDARCTCGTGEHAKPPTAEMRESESCSHGKHPLGLWSAETALATEEALFDAIEARDGRPTNLGLVLGPKSGVVDIEWDDALGRQYAEEIGLTKIETPTYTSGRSEHRLFRWDDSLSGCKAKVVLRGLEFRLGSAANAQSVMPPSWHWSGRQYEWKPGFNLDDLPFAEIPEQLVAALVNGGGPRDGEQDPSKPRARFVLHNKVGKGERHPHLLRYATWKVFRTPYYLRHDEQEDMLAEMLAVNLQHCDPPKPREQVAQILASAIEYRRRHDEAGKPLPEREDLAAIAQEIIDGGAAPETPVIGLALHGLEWRPHPEWQAGEWFPGTWTVQVKHSDPPALILEVPGWKDTPCRGKIEFAFDEFRSSIKVANRVFVETRRVILDDDRAAWECVWRGQSGNSKRPQISGLVTKLLERKDRAKDLIVGTSSLRFAELAGYVLQQVKRAAKPRSEEAPEPYESGRPCWVRPDELWLQWGRVWEEVMVAHKGTTTGERNRLRSMLLEEVGAQDFEHRRHRFPAGYLEFVVWGPAWLDALQRIAAGGDGRAPAAPDDRANTPSAEIPGETEGAA